jgi:hypothetical protein
VLPSRSARQSSLDAAIERHVAEGARIVSRSHNEAVLARGHRVNHTLHFLLGFVTFFLWWILVWLPLAILGGEKREVLHADPVGNVSRRIEEPWATHRPLRLARSTEGRVHTQWLIRFALLIGAGLIAIAVTGVIASAGGGGTARKGTQSPHAGQAASSGAASSTPARRTRPNGRANVATASFTPRVGPQGKVTVGPLTWAFSSVRHGKTIRDPSLPGPRAAGIFLVVQLRGRSAKDAPEIITHDSVKLQIPGGAIYSPTTRGEIEAGGKTLLPKQIQPGHAFSGQVVFDVPSSVLQRHPQLQFNELGPGSTTGYISLP